MSSIPEHPRPGEAERAAARYREATGEEPPWTLNWLDGAPVPRGDGGISDVTLLLHSDGRPMSRPWTARDRARVLELLATSKT